LIPIAVAFGRLYHCTKHHPSFEPCDSWMNSTSRSSSSRSRSKCGFLSSYLRLSNHLLEGLLFMVLHLLYSLVLCETVIIVPLA